MKPVKHVSLASNKLEDVTEIPNEKGLNDSWLSSKPKKNTEQNHLRRRLEQLS